MLRKLTGLLLNNSWYALLVILVTAFIPLIGSIAVIIAALITLRKGPLPGALAFIIATLPYFLGFMVAGNQEIITFYSLSIFLLSNLLTFLMALVLRISRNWAAPIQLISLLCIVIICILHLFYPDMEGWWAAHLNNYFDNATTLFNTFHQETISSTMRTEMIGILQRYATGMVTSFIIINAILQLSVARWWQNKIFNSGHSEHELHEIRLSSLAGWFFVACLLLAYLENAVILDIIPIIYLVFCIAGMSVVHKIMAQLRHGWLGLILFYILTILLLPFSIMLLAMAALLDVWFDFRMYLRVKH